MGTKELEDGMIAFDRLGVAAERAERKVGGIGRTSRDSARQSVGAFQKLVQATEQIGPGIEMMVRELIQMRAELRDMLTEMRQMNSAFADFGRTNHFDQLNRQLDQTEQNVNDIADAASGAASRLGDMRVPQPPVGLAQNIGASVAGGAVAGAAAAAATAGAGAGTGMAAAMAESAAKVSQSARMIEGEFTDAFAAIAASVETARAPLGALTVDFTDVSDAVREQSRLLTSSFGDMGNTVRDQTLRIGTSFRDMLDDMVATTRERVGQIGQAMGSLEGPSLDDEEDYSLDVQSMIKRYNDVMTDLYPTTQKMIKATNELHTAFEAAFHTGDIDATRAALEGMEESFNSRKFVEEWQKVKEEFESTLEILDPVATELDETTRAFHAAVKELMAENNGFILGAMGQFDQAVSQSREKFNHWAADVAEYPANAVAGFDQVGNEIAKIAERGGRDFLDMGEKAGGAADNIERDFLDLGNKTENIFKRIDSAVIGGARRFAGAWSAAASKVRGAMTGLRSLIASVGLYFSLGALISTVDEAEKTIAALASTIRSTNNVIGTSVSELVEWSGQLQATSTYSAQTIQNTQALLLTFNRIGKETFPRATQAAIDMAARFGGDLRSATIQLGKALQSPVEGVSALREVGVSFTNSQLGVIKSMLATGDAAGAQNVILTELENQVKGAAAAARDTLGGSLAALRNNFSDLVVSISETSGNTDLLRAAFEAANDGVEWMKDNVPVVTGVVLGLASAMGVAAVMAAALWVTSLGPVGLAIAGVSAVVGVLVGVLGGGAGSLIGTVNDVIAKNGDLRNSTISIWDKIGAVVGAGTQWVITQVQAMADAVIAIFAQMGSNISLKLGAVKNAMGAVLEGDFSGAANIMETQFVSVFENIGDAAQHAYNERISQFDFRSEIEKRLSEDLVIGEMGARVRAGETGIGRGTPPPPDTDTTGAAEAANALKQLRAEADAARRVAATYGDMLAAKIRLGEVNLQLAVSTGDIEALEAEALQLERVGRAAEELQAQLALEAKLRDIKAKRGTQMYRQQELAIRQEHQYQQVIKQTQQALADVDALQRVQQQAQAASVQADAYAEVARVASEVVRQGEAQVEVLDRAEREAALVVEDYEALVRLQQIGISRESEFYRQAVESVKVIDNKRRAQERYSQILDASRQITNHRREAEQIRAIADAYAVSRRAGEEMTAAIEAENFVRSLNLDMLGEQGAELEKHARRAIEARQESDRYRQSVEDARGAFDEYRDSLQAAGEFQRTFSDVSGTAVQGLEDSLVSLAMTGKASFADLAQSLLADMSRIIIRATIMRAILSFISPGEPLTGGSGSDILTNITPAAAGAVLNRPTLMPTTYGPVRGGESGSEALLPLQTNRQGKLAVSAEGVGNNVTYSIVNHIEAQPGMSEQDIAKQAGAWRRQMNSWMDGRLQDHKRQRGLLSEGMRG